MSGLWETKMRSIFRQLDCDGDGDGVLMKEDVDGYVEKFAQQTQAKDEDLKTWSEMMDEVCMLLIAA